MKTLLKFKFPANVRSRSLIRRHKTRVASGRINYAKLKPIWSSSVTVISQRYSGYAFYIEEVSMEVKRPITLKVEVNYSCLIFAYMLRGKLNFPVSDTHREINFEEHHCCAIPIREGEFSLTLGLGYKRWIYFALRPEWLLKMRSVYPELILELQKVVNGDPELQLFAPQVLNSNVAKQLTKLRDIRLVNKVDLELALLHSISLLVTDYHGHLHAAEEKPIKSEQQIAYEARDYIIETVEKGQIPDVRYLAEPFHVEPKVLRRYCINTFHMNLQELLEDAQMKVGHNRIQNGQKVKEVSNSLGFAEISVFSRKYKRFFGASPKKLRFDRQIR